MRSSGHAEPSGPRARWRASGVHGGLLQRYGAFQLQQLPVYDRLEHERGRAQPSTDTIQTNWDGYSWAIVARGNGVASNAQLVQFVRSTQNPHVPPVWHPLGTTPQQFSYNLNAGGLGTEFSILAQKAVFNSTPSPAPSTSPTPANVWTFNAFTTAASASGVWRFEDSMGAGGPVDPQFVSPRLNMTTCFDNTYYALDQNISDPAAEIVSIEIANNPAKNPCSSSTGS